MQMPPYSVGCSQLDSYFFGNSRPKMHSCKTSTIMRHSQCNTQESGNIFENLIFPFPPIPINLFPFHSHSHSILIPIPMGFPGPMGPMGIPTFCTPLVHISFDCFGNGKSKCDSCFCHTNTYKTLEQKTGQHSFARKMTQNSDLFSSLSCRKHFWIFHLSGLSSDMPLQVST